MLGRRPSDEDTVAASSSRTAEHADTEGNLGDADLLGSSASRRCSSIYGRWNHHRQDRRLREKASILSRTCRDFDLKPQVGVRSTGVPRVDWLHCQALQAGACCVLGCDHEPQRPGVQKSGLLFSDTPDAHRKADQSSAETLTQANNDVEIAPSRIPEGSASTIVQVRLRTVGV